MYGTFLCMQKPRTQAFSGAANEPPGALEVFTEFSALELVGTLRTMPLIGHWTISPIEQLLIKVASDESGTGTLRAVVFPQLGNSKASTHYELPWVSPSRPMDSLGGSQQCPRC